MNEDLAELEASIEHVGELFASELFEARDAAHGLAVALGDLKRTLTTPRQRRENH
jgi:hypothetical protein